jgi:vancomycin resistance protein YoaR
MRADVDVGPRRERRAVGARRRTVRASRRLWPWSVAALAALLVAALVAGIGFAGSTARIPAGVTIGGINVGGLTAEEARAKLGALAHRYVSIPVVFTAAGSKLVLTPASLDGRVNWGTAIQQARDAGDGPLPFRGLRRLKVRLLGLDLRPLADVYDAGLRYRIEQFAKKIRRPARSAAIELDGLTPRIAPAQAGRELDQDAAAVAVQRAFGGFEREPVALVVRTMPPTVTTQDLGSVLDQVRTALSGPIRYGFAGAHWTVTRRELARLLSLPSGGARGLAVAGPAADAYFDRYAKAVRRAPRSADFSVRADGSVAVVRGVDGRVLEREASAHALLTAALSTTERNAELVVKAVAPKLTTAEAKAMGIERVLSTYHTAYAGTYDRIHNLELAVGFLNGTRIAPGATFSFNDAVGPRTEGRGFRAAPVIVGTDYEEGVGGGVSQVATTVFNAAWEAGLKIIERNPHALYIARYQLGRDATVNYPSLDLKFLNDTDHWLVLRSGYDDSGIWVSLLGADLGRRVVSEAGTLDVVAEPKLEKVLDPTLPEGEQVVDDFGEPSTAVTVTRKVYQHGKLLYDETWQTTYRSQPKVVRVGTMPKPAPPKPEPQKPEPQKPPPDEPAAEAPPADDTPPATTTTETTTTTTP